MDGIAIRTLQTHEWGLYRAIRLRSLADSPDAFGSTLAEEQTYSEQTWSGRLARAAEFGRDYPLVAEQGGEGVGLLWAKFNNDEPTVVNIYQVWVAPECRGRGVAAAMLRNAVRWARESGAECVELAVTCGDTPAVRLYTREGFVNHGEPEPLRADCDLLSQTMRLRLS